jgi:hypothetical protein
MTCKDVLNLFFMQELSDTHGNASAEKTKGGL